MDCGEPTRCVFALQYRGEHSAKYEYIPKIVSLVAEGSFYEGITIIDLKRTKDDL